MAFSLSALLHPVKIDELRGWLRDRQPRVIRGGVERLQGFLEIQALRSSEDFLSYYVPKLDPRPLIAWGCKAKGTSDIIAMPFQLGALYESGFTLVFFAVHQKLAELRPFMRTIEHELGLPYGSVDMDTFASRAGSGADFHWDAVPLLSIQVRGRKKWYYAVNEHVEWPHVAWAIGAPIPPSLIKYAKAPLPDEVPPNVQCVELGPGDMLFAPQGTWHRTDAIEDSWSYTIGFRNPNWLFAVVDEVVSSMQAELLSRKCPLPETPATVEGAEAILRRLREVVNGITPAQLLEHIRATITRADQLGDDREPPKRIISLNPGTS